MTYFTSHIERYRERFPLPVTASFKMPPDNVLQSSDEQALRACSQSDIISLQKVLRSFRDKSAAGATGDQPEMTSSLTAKMLDITIGAENVEMVDLILRTFPTTIITENLLALTIKTQSIPLYSTLLAHDPNIVNMEFYDGRDNQINRATVMRAPTAYLQYLLSCGVDPHPALTISPLVLLALPWQTDAVAKCEMLLQHGVRIDGTGALAAAARDGKTDLLETLLKHGADVNCVIQDTTPDRTWCPLHEAVEGGHRRIVEVLLASGVDSDILDNKGRTAMMIAKEKGDVEIIELLEAAVDRT